MKRFITFLLVAAFAFCVADHVLLDYHTRAAHSLFSPARAVQLLDLGLDQNLRARRAENLAVRFAQQSQAQGRYIEKISGKLNVVETQRDLLQEYVNRLTRVVTEAGLELPDYPSQAELKWECEGEEGEVTE